MTDMRIKHIFTAAAVLALCLVLCAPAYAANKVAEIRVDVSLRPDGSAVVVQTWEGDFSEGTECYFPVTNLGDMTLSDLHVSDESHAYIMADSWEPDASFEEKSGRYGLNPTGDGYEVCWGISSYGHHRYVVEYTLGGLVGDYEDLDGFLFQFVPDGMNTGPSDVTVRIVTSDGTPLTGENAGIWAFGFDGQIEFEDAGVLAYTAEPVGGDNSVIVMLQLNKGILNPARIVSGTFEDVKARAFEGSDYEIPDNHGTGDIEDYDNLENDGLYTIIGAACILGAASAFWATSSKRKLTRLYKGAGYWREPPIGGNLEASFVLANRFSQTGGDGNLIAAALIRLLTAGCLVPEREGDMGNTSLRLVKSPADVGIHALTASQLYDLLVKAAGSDGILKEQELERYCRTNYTALLNIVQDSKRDGGETLEGIGCYKSPCGPGKLSNLTDRGRTLLLQLMGYKKYLLEFSLIAERGINEALIWQDCLIYAALLGIGEQVLKELRKFYPHTDANICMAEYTCFIAYRYHHITYGTAKNAEAKFKRNSGGGGFTSIGGGGGFSGGGSGGGTR